MHRLFYCSAILLLLAARSYAHRPVSNQSQQVSAGGGKSDDVSSTNSGDPVPQNLPCANQSKSLKELTKSFNMGRLSSTSDVTGTWVAISLFSDGHSSLNCAGVKRGITFEEVIVAKGYSIELHIIGAVQETVTAKPDRNASLVFPVDEGGDASPVYRCRLTERQTLACLNDVYREGNEFKKMTVRKDEIAVSTDDSYGFASAR
jgi:hypothetical protein